jgi:hypothetical protein
MSFSRYLGNFDSQSWHYLESRIRGLPGCLKQRVGHFIHHRGTCPRDELAVGLREVDATNSRVRFIGDDSWMIGRRRYEVAGDSDGSDDLQKRPTNVFRVIYLCAA